MKRGNRNTGPSPPPLFENKWWHTKAARVVLAALFCSLIVFEGVRIWGGALYAKPPGLDERVESLPMLSEEEQAEVERHNLAILKILEQAEQNPHPEGVPPKDADLLSKRMVERVEAVRKEVGAQRELVASHENKISQYIYSHVLMLVAILVCLYLDYQVLGKANRALEKEEPVKEYRAKSAELDKKLRETADAKRTVEQTVNRRVKEKLDEHAAEMKRQADAAAEVTRKADDRRRQVDSAASEAQRVHTEAQRMKGEAAAAQQEAQLRREQTSRDRQAAEAERRTAEAAKKEAEGHLVQLRALAGHTMEQLGQFLGANPAAAALIFKYAPGEAPTSPA